jgi:hypothetical protein
MTPRITYGKPSTPYLELRDAAKSLTAPGG